MWYLTIFVLINTLLLYNFYNFFYDVYLEILMLKIYFENCTSQRKKTKENRGSTMKVHLYYFSKQKKNS